MPSPVPGCPFPPKWTNDPCHSPPPKCGLPLPKCEWRQAPFALLARRVPCDDGAVHVRTVSSTPVPSLSYQRRRPRGTQLRAKDAGTHISGTLFFWREFLMAYQVVCEIALGGELRLFVRRAQAVDRAPGGGERATDGATDARVDRGAGAYTRPLLSSTGAVFVTRKHPTHP
jgi:hypothetical protein